MANLKIFERKKEIKQRMIKLNATSQELALMKISNAEDEILDYLSELEINEDLLHACLGKQTEQVEVT